jgi:hypothetical protein
MAWEKKRIMKIKYRGGSSFMEKSVLMMDFEAEENGGCKELFTVRLNNQHVNEGTRPISA